MNPEKIRQDFPVFDEYSDLTYLDNAATSQKPQQVIDAVNSYYSTENANVGRGLYDLAGDATEAYQSSRKTVADFIDANPSEIIFVRNSTEAENLLASSLEFEGDIVLSDMAHHSEQLPWRRKAEETGKEVKYLETEDGRISVESAEEKIDQNTGLIAISHVSNVFGTENPVKEIVEIAHANDALVVLDGAQSVPHQPVDVEELDVDFLCFSGHKMLGPTGIGVLYGKKRLLEEMKPYQVGGGMISSVTKEDVSYERSPRKFEAGTPNIAGAVGLAAAVEYLEDIGMDEVESHDRHLSGLMHDRLEALEEVDVISPKESMLVSFSVDTAHPHDVAEILNSHDVAVRAGNHCAQPLMEKLDVNGTVRASPYIYNTEDDVEELVAAVKEAVEVFR